MTQIIDATKSMAFTVAKQLASVEGFGSELRDNVAADLRRKRGAVHLWHRISVAVADGKLPKDFWDKLPRPGTPEYNKDGTRNNLFDTYQMEEGERKRPASFYAHLTDALDSLNIIRDGQTAIKTALEGLRLANKQETFEEAPEQYKKMNPAQRKAEIETMESLKQSARSQVRKAFQLHFQMEDVKEYGMSVKIAMVKTADGVEPAKTGKPITVQDPDNSGNFNVYTVDEFLNLKPGEAEKSGGDFAALNVSGAKKRAPGGPKAKDAPWTGANFEARLNDFASKIEDSAFRARILARINDANDQEFVATMGKIVPWFIELWEGGLDKKVQAMGKAQLAASGRAA